jgi:hypothetical protein
MRKLLMAIFIPILMLLGTPALLAAIMYDGSGYEDMPVHLYTEDADFQKMLFQELSDSLDELDTGVNADMEYNLHEDIINTAIYEQILQSNPNYAPGDDCATDEECYIFATDLPIGEGAQARLVGAWVEFEQNKFILNVFLDVQLSEGIAYRTVIETHFKLQDHPGEKKYTLQFEKINLGNLPIPSSMISGILNLVENNFADLNLDEAVQGLPLGSFSFDTFTYTLEKEEIVAKIGETEEGVEPSDDTLMMQEIASIVFEQGLLDFELVDEELILAARISKFSSDDINDIPEYLYEQHVVIGTDDNGDPIYGVFDDTAFDAAVYLQDVFTEYVFNNALIGGGFEITEETFNKVIYDGAKGFENTGTTQELELPDGTVREVEVGLKAVWFTIEEDAIYANGLFKLDNTTSVMKLKATKVEEASSTTELVFDFTELTFGKDADETALDYISVTNLEVFESYLTGIEDIEFGSIQEIDGEVFLTISSDALTAVLTEGQDEETVVINGINLIHGALVLDVQPADAELAQALEDLNAAINDVLADETLITDITAALNPDNDNEEAQEVIDAMTNIQTILTDENQEIEAEDVEVLFNEFEDLDEAEQQVFLTEVAEALPEDVYNSFLEQFGSTAFPEVDENTTP